jgi:hypothetical protein
MSMLSWEKTWKLVEASVKRLLRCGHLQRSFRLLHQTPGQHIDQGLPLREGDVLSMPGCEQTRGRRWRLRRDGLVQVAGYPPSHPRVHPEVGGRGRHLEQVWQVVGGNWSGKWSQTK